MPYEIGVTYAPATNSGPGRLLFLREGTLIAQPFDERRLALAGEPVPVAERVGSFRDGAFFSVSANDVLVYRPADTDSQLAWFDRQGIVAGRASEPGGFREVALSPDGTRAVASRTNPLDTANETESGSRSASRPRAKAGAVHTRHPWIQRGAGPVFANGVMGRLRLESVRRAGSVRPRVCDRLQQRVSQHGRK